MNTLIIAGCMAVALFAGIGAIALAMGEKTPAATQKTPAQTPPVAAEPTEAAKPTAAPVVAKKELMPVQSLPVAQDDARAAFINGQFHELATQLRILHQQAQEIERRLSMLSQAADAIKRSQSPSFSIEEEYSLPEPVASAV
ncbi:MAG TPA: hypothetical protein VGU68_13515 [Ktedonobacteraceae bacterium]|nr:hypothetical protein [Ktedonobacteraceae bacterium]HEV2661620.1 hypothetical protein [Ktedonobacteraceae bacterium]